MKFPDVYVTFTRGLPVRRSSWEPGVRVRVIDPKVAPDTEGPMVTYRVEADGRPFFGFTEFETKDAAAEALKGERAAHTRQWTAYRKARNKYEETPVEDRGGAPAPPQRPEDFYAECTVVERPVSTATRINQPYLVRHGARGVIEPWAFSPADLLAADWEEA